MYCELIDYMGSDERVVDSARVSFSKTSSNFTEDQNHKLIKYLSDHDHWSPFSHVVITMRETVPIFVARQRFKHVVGFTYNEVSRRYVDDNPEFYVPDVWRKRAENKKQGSSDEIVGEVKSTMFFTNSGGVLLDDQIYYEEFIQACVGMYEGMLNMGVAPEQARMILPQSMYTSYYTTGSLAAWARAYNLRSKEDSQREIQDLAKQWNNIISNIDDLKYSWSALTNEVTNS